MRKRFYKVLSQNDELQNVSRAISGLKGKIYEIGETDAKMCQLLGV